MQGLTKRQQMVLEYITQSISDHGYPPTLREIGAHMGIRSTNGVNDHLRALERKGYLKRDDMKSRALRPVGAESAPSKDGEGVAEVPLIGRVTPGQPVLSEQNIEDRLIFDLYLVGSHRDVFALRVKDDSMIDAGVKSGDIVLVRKQMYAERRDIVAIRLGDQAIIKHYHPEKDIVRLMPANRSCEPIVIRKEDFSPTQILGVVVGLYRRL